MRAADIPFPVSGFPHPARHLGGTCLVICCLIIWICIPSAANPVAVMWPWPLQSAKEYWQAMNVLARDDLGFGFVLDKTFGIPFKTCGLHSLGIHVFWFGFGRWQICASSDQHFELVIWLVSASFNSKFMKSTFNYQLIIAFVLPSLHV